MDVRLKYVNTNSLNVRRGPGLKYSIAYSLPYNTDITVRFPGTVADGYTWVERNKYPGLWVANEYLRDPAARSKIGLHVSQFVYDPNALLAMLSRMYSAGNPISVCKILGPSEQITPAQVKAISPPTTVVYRLYRDSDGGYDLPASELFRRIDGNQALWPTDFFQIRNEWNDVSPGAIQLRLQDMQWCEANSGNYRKRLVDPGCSTGNPDLLPPDPNSPWMQPHFQNFMRYVRDHGHRFSLDEYYRNDGDYELFRFLHHVYPYLPADLIANMPRMIFTEFSQDDIAYLSYNGLLSLFNTWNTELLKYSFVDGACVFAMGDSGGWAGYNTANNILVYEAVG